MILVTCVIDWQPVASMLNQLELVGRVQHTSGHVHHTFGPRHSPVPRIATVGPGQDGTSQVHHCCYLRLCWASLLSLPNFGAQCALAPTFNMAFSGLLSSSRRVGWVYRSDSIAYLGKLGRSAATCEQWPHVVEAYTEEKLQDCT